MQLVAWSREVFRNIRHRLDEKQKVLEELINIGYGDNLDQISLVRDDINDLLHHEKVFWRQRSRAIWLPTRDKNTKFFHKQASQRRRKNHIKGLMDENWSWRSNKQQINGIAESYFQGIFSTSHLTNVEEVLTSAASVVMEEMNQELSRPFMGDEVGNACFAMLPLESRGLDGMLLFFFQKYWHIVGGNVTEALLSVLNSSHILNKMNFTHILLIPKIKAPQHMVDYRPINLSNGVSRIVSKVLANHVKTILLNIISNTQSTFVPDRLIFDNTMVAYEMLH